MVDGNFEIRPAQMLQNHFKLFDYFTMIDGNFEIRPAQMLQIYSKSIDYFTMVEENFEIGAAQMLQIASNCLIISPWLMEILKYDLLKCPKSLQIV